MFVLLNGELVPEREAVISVHDRSFLYGDGLFETIRVHNRLPFRWSRHMARLQQGAQFLKLRPPFDSERLRSFAATLIKKNEIFKYNRQLLN